MKLLAKDRRLLSQKCANCPKTPTAEEGGKFKVCSACKWLYFCSVECQHALWPSHKPLCGLLCTVLAPENPREREFLGIIDKAQKTLGEEKGKKWEQEMLESIADYLSFVRDRIEKGSANGNGELPRADKPDAIGRMRKIFELLKTTPGDVKFPQLLPFVYEIVMNKYLNRSSWREVFPEALRGTIEPTYPAIPDARYMTLFLLSLIERYKQNVEAWSKNEAQLKQEETILIRASSFVNDLILGKVPSVEQHESIPSLHQAMAGISDPSFSGVSNLGQYGNINLQKQFVAFGGAKIAEEYLTTFKHIPPLYVLGLEFDLTVGTFPDETGFIKYKSF